MIKDGKPYTCEYNIPWCKANVDSALITDLSDKEQEAAETWVKSHVYPSSKVSSHTSYGIKHMLEEVTWCYVSNNQAKDLLMRHGYHPIDPDALNWEYKIKIIDGRTKISLRKAYFSIKGMDCNLFQNYRTLRNVAIWKTRPNVRTFFVCMNNNPLRYWFGDAWEQIERADNRHTTLYRRMLTELVDSISDNSCRQFLRENKI